MEHQIVEGQSYILKNGMTVKFKRNRLPYYCFTVCATDDPDYQDCREVFRADGIGYHDDCGYVVDFEKSEALFDACAEADEMYNEQD